MKKFGLIGKDLQHSFSKIFFNKKFQKLNLYHHSYNNYEINNINEVINIIDQENLIGLNITIPYKKEIIKILDIISDEVKSIKSVNTIKIENKKLIGYNTDVIGFEQSIMPIIGNRKNALILGDGGASNAVQYVLKKNKINFKVVSRKGKNKYQDLNDQDIISNEIIINTTPLGMNPNSQTFPNIKYDLLNKKHLVYDLIYNPKETLFLQKAKNKGCQIKNGNEMLKIQANESWTIWNH